MAGFVVSVSSLQQPGPLRQKKKSMGGCCDMGKRAVHRSTRKQAITGLYLSGWLRMCVCVHGQIHYTG